jgi:hypothetical protein
MYRLRGTKCSFFKCMFGRAIAQAVSRWLPTAAAPGSNPGLVKWDLWWTKWLWGRFSPSTSVSPANLHCTKFSIIIITRGRYNRPFSVRRAEWTPPLCELKKKCMFNPCFHLMLCMNIQIVAAITLLSIYNFRRTTCQTFTIVRLVASSSDLVTVQGLAKNNR